MECDYRTDCQVKQSTGRCFEDTHHIYWPERAYSTKLERFWRNLGKHTIELCRRIHQDLHAEDAPPEKPERDEMINDILESDEHIPSSLLKKIEGGNDER